MVYTPPHRSKQDGAVMSWLSLRYNFIQQSLHSGSTQVQICSRCVGDLQQGGSLTMVPAGNKAKCLRPVNHNTKRIRHHHRFRFTVGVQGATYHVLGFINQGKTATSFLCSDFVTTTLDCIKFKGQSFKRFDSILKLDVLYFFKV